MRRRKPLPRIRRTIRKAALEWRLHARRGIRVSGLAVVLSGACGLAAVSGLLPSHVAGALAALASLPSFGWFSANLLAAVFQVEGTAGPLPECPACRVPLNVARYRCGVCQRSHLA